MSQQNRNAELVALLETDFVGRNEPNYAWKSACSAFQALPGLRGFWPMSSVDENGAAMDLSVQSTPRILTLAGGLVYTWFATALLAPTAFFNGANAYLWRASEAGLDITGTETFNATATRGLSIGGWFYTVAYDAGVTPYMGKWQVANQLSHLLAAVGAANPSFRITTDGFTQVVVTSTVTRVTGPWTFIVATFDPSTSLNIYVDDNPVDTLAAGIPASIFNSTSRFSIGEEAVDGVFYNGYASMCFLSSMVLPQTTIRATYYQTKAMFGK